MDREKDKDKIIRRKIKLLLVDHFHNDGFEYQKFIEEDEEDEKKEVKNSIVGLDQASEEKKAKELKKLKKKKEK